MKKLLIASLVLAMSVPVLAQTESDSAVNQQGMEDTSSADQQRMEDPSAAESAADPSLDDESTIDSTNQRMEETETIPSESSRPQSMERSDDTSGASATGVDRNVEGEDLEEEEEEL